ncbi:MAG: alkaline phosphatase family protein [Candidatus Wallbacteria bacterium]|nr:alkaline phosphatase family protein [Candidatus Wallbacteria bacterium]
MKAWSDFKPDIRVITPLICHLFGIRLPEQSSDYIPGEVLALENECTLCIERCLIYAPDAVGSFLFGYCPAVFKEIKAAAPIELPLRAAFPPVTPVCFATMFTGTSPEEHGLSVYHKPVLKCDTLFDALIRAGKRVAIVAVKNSSIDLIFRERELDYFSEESDSQVIERALYLIERNHHDFILAYNQEFDDSLHATTPVSEQSIQAVKNHTASFLRLARAANQHWKLCNRAILFAPDHGAHSDPLTGKGTHGQDIPEDMDIWHYLSLEKGIDY